MSVFIPSRPAQRAHDNVTPAPDGCWISNYSIGSHGYAQVGWKDPDADKMRGTTAHRASWVHANGRQIPDGMTVDHTCKNRRCVNPAHLRLLSNFENARRTSGRDWQLGSCINGHSNEHLTYRGAKRACGICRAEWDARWRAKRDAA